MTNIGVRRGSVDTTRVGEAVSAPRAAVYLRVSTGRQAEQDLSIPDQKAQSKVWCAARGWSVVADYVEPGSTATDDKRPAFQKMIERACDGENTFDVIVVHSFSRFFRDAFGLEFYVRKLAKHGVRLVSITQELGDDPSQVMMRQVIALFDEYQSKENAKHVIRSMKENARQGFWNGSRPPLGYKTIEAEQRGQRVKKKLAIDPVEAEQVRLMFKLFLEGNNGSGPMGIKAMVSWLNQRGYRTRGGASWGVGQMYTLLTNPVYSGRLRYNWVEHRTGRRKPESDIVYSDAPAIIEQETFDRVQTSLRARNPRVTPSRVITGPILLTGLAVCATCGGGMTLRTGTSHRGDVYKYYACSTHARQGKTRCKGRSIRMDKLDTLVTRHLSERLFEPARLAELLTALASRRADKAAAAERRGALLEREANDADARLRRLYRLVEDGIAEMDGALKDRIAALRAARDGAMAALERAKSGARQTARLGPTQIEQFGRVMRENLTTGEIPFRKAYLGSIVDRIEVDDREVRILGRKDVLEQCVLASWSPTGQVRRSVRGWLGDEDSNLD
jgi:site-specific DNA recombinase